MRNKKAQDASRPGLFCGIAAGAAMPVFPDGYFSNFFIHAASWCGRKPS